MSAQAQIVGGWSAYHPLTAQDKKVFQEALHGFVGVQYTPLEVSTQVVNGTNYRYLSNAQVPGSELIYKVIVSIYAPTNGAPHITGIQQI
ncbi:MULTISPECIES: hypothetical protein [unclassified Pseudomonas]|uniref:hypothetical protein n=1 Tax=unclassified Pseudomonas TaxID=196821 RepID=UPI000BA45FA6|nr:MULTISPECIES: hypothetical protein [unclassified Pseudomonas]MCU1722845.1 hypothetical protein [Pseudomonas sp. 5P_5.1_Bac1]MCU1731872.1 hypothetical protein [Pseudomonas sp. 20P_3.2_Bac4]MCU1742613.1 hypothetical protein [Pseudomonas sp. 20P_3.2_Bac5]